MKMLRKFGEQLRYEWSVLTRAQRVLEVGKFIAVLAFAYVCFGLMGCTTMTEYERADRDIQTREQYYRCLAAFSAAGRPWYATRTRSAMDVKLGREPDPQGMRQEMRENGCRP